MTFAAFILDIAAVQHGLTEIEIIVIGTDFGDQGGIDRYFYQFGASADRTFPDHRYFASFLVEWEKVKERYLACSEAVLEPDQFLNHYVKLGIKMRGIYGRLKEGFVIVTPLEYHRFVPSQAIFGNFPSFFC